MIQSCGLPVYIPNTEQEFASDHYLLNNNVSQVHCDSHIECLNEGGIYQSKALSYAIC